MQTFHCDRCNADLIDWPRSQSVDEHGALMPAETTREAHMRGHFDLDRMGSSFVPLMSEV